jgi:SHS2 domain-containing protein
MSATSRTLRHVGEWKIELRASALGELFVELARVLADAAGPRREPAGEEPWERVELSARDLTALFVDWANELIGRSEVSGRAYEQVRNLVIDAGPAKPARVAAELRGPLVESWESPAKAATYHGALVDRDEGEWRAVLLIDV